MSRQTAIIGNFDTMDLFEQQIHRQSGIAESDACVSSLLEGGMATLHSCCPQFDPQTIKMGL